MKKELRSANKKNKRFSLWEIVDFFSYVFSLIAKAVLSIVKNQS